jgi:hypothetical protein
VLSQVNWASAATARPTIFPSRATLLVRAALPAVIQKLEPVRHHLLSLEPLYFSATRTRQSFFRVGSRGYQAATVPFDPPGKFKFDENGSHALGRRFR